MEQIKALYAKLIDFCTNTMKLDGALHWIACCIIATILKLFLPIWLVIFLTVFIMVAKEVWWDYKLKQGTIEIRDVGWGMIGMLVGLL